MILINRLFSESDVMNNDLNCNQLEAFGKCLYYYNDSLLPITENMMRYIYRFNQPRLYNFEDVLANPMDGKLCETIKKQNVLVIDDVTTSGSTLNEVLRTLRILNEDNEITIFSLIGRKDLMADSF